LKLGEGGSHGLFADVISIAAWNGRVKRLSH